MLITLPSAGDRVNHISPSKSDNNLYNLFKQGVPRENPNHEEELSTSGFGNDLQKKYVEFRDLDLFTDFTLNVENKSYRV